MYKPQASVFHCYLAVGLKLITSHNPITVETVEFWVTGLEHHEFKSAQPSNQSMRRYVKKESILLSVPPGCAIHQSEIVLHKFEM